MDADEEEKVLGRGRGGKGVMVELTFARACARAQPQTTKQTPNKPHSP